MNIFRPDRPILKKRKALLVLGLYLALALPCSAHVVIDKKGREIDVSRPFARIISLYGAHTENLFALGLDREIIGVSVNDTYPVQVKSKKRFSYHDDPERFLAERPDLVLVRPMIDNGYPKFIQQLEQYGIKVVSLQPSSVDEMYDYWLTLGDLTGRSLEAKRLVRGFKDKISRVQNRIKSRVKVRKKVFFEAIHSRMKTFIPGAMPIFALETAGGINVAPDARSSRNTNIAIYGKEQILEKASRIDVFLAQKGIMNPVNLEMIMDEPGFEIIKAVKTRQVFLIDENIVSRPVPRLYQGIKAIGHMLYPDVFAQLDMEKEK
ncbi:ABC transporter substrate-binding protein [Desulfospira joergensenii]|uniref:ABC transporter substrate-binding protein n=1 Tax=Desulfospira joergensenii TaxID=53329 RepID=UPI00048145D7|nr:ABC transporter substrate-binding protein [Desulfospira joergensenii]